ncbi:MAG: hypothetical protein LBD04_08820 [Synergistaceae bacterium]|jgi:FMN phosphatase YigB (HAD superfamily)|nr:hypothetical protein [Synergistaceae bacterium]
MAMLYSFDLFDTLLARRTEKPSGVFALMQKSLAQRSQEGKNTIPFELLENFALSRIEAEREARQACAFDEIRFEEIYARLAEKYFLGERLIGYLMKKEIETERAALYPIVENIELFRRRKKEARVAILSDMYLSSDVLRLFLRDANAELFSDVPIYVSSEWRVTKAGGGLFGVAALKEKARWGEMEHIGDNRRADYEAPRMWDIPATLYVRKNPAATMANVASRSSPLLDLLAGVQEALTERRLGETSSNPFGKKRERREDSLYLTGGCVTGPLLWAFTWWLLKITQAMGHKRLYFLSRDGQILMKIANVMIEAFDLDIETRYLYSSRLSWLFASMEEFGRRDSAWVVQPLPYLSLKMVSSRLHTPKEKFLEILQRDRLPDVNVSKWDMPLSEKQIAKLESWIRDRWGFFKPAVMEERALLKEYARQEGLLDAKTVALVDVGWLCRSQDALVDVLRALENDTVRELTRVDGFYMGCVRDAKQERGNRKYGMLTFPDDEGLCGVAEGEFTKFICFVESMLEGDHGHVKGYKREGTPVVPMLSEEANIQAMNWGLKEFQRGIVDFAVEFSQLLCAVDIVPSRRELEEILKTVFLSCTNPKTVPKFWSGSGNDFASVMGDFPYAWDPSHTLSRKLARKISVKEYFSYCRSNSQEQCDITYWLAGSLARSGWGVRLCAAAMNYMTYTVRLPIFPPHVVKDEVRKYARYIAAQKTILFFPFCGDTHQARSHLEIAMAFSPEKPLIVFTGPALDDSLKSEFEKAGRVWLLMRDRSERERRLKSLRLNAVRKFLKKSKNIRLLGASSSDFYKLLLDKDMERVQFWEILTECHNIHNPRTAERLAGVIAMRPETVEDVCEVWKANGIDNKYLEKIRLTPDVECIPGMVTAPNK